MTDDILPPCFGTYEEKDKECDGGPCIYRKRCGVFTAHLRKSRKRSTAYLSIGDDRSIPKHGHVAFLRFCEQLLKDEAQTKIKKQTKKLDPNRDKRKDGPSITAKRRSRATKARRAKEKRNQLLIVYEKFRVDFEKGLKKKRTFAASDQIISTGQFYQFDRLAVSDYIGIRCKTNRGVDFPLVVFKLKTSTQALDVKLPFTVDEFENLVSKSTFKKLKLEDRMEGRLKSIIKNAKPPTLALLCEELVKAVNKEKIELPSV